MEERWTKLKKKSLLNTEKYRKCVERKKEYKKIRRDGKKRKWKKMAKCKEERMIESGEW